MTRPVTPKQLADELERLLLRQDALRAADMEYLKRRLDRLDPPHKKLRQRFDRTTGRWELR